MKWSSDEHRTQQMLIFFFAFANSYGGVIIVSNCTSEIALWRKCIEMMTKTPAHLKSQNNYVEIILLLNNYDDTAFFHLSQLSRKDFQKGLPSYCLFILLKAGSFLCWQFSHVRQTML